MCEGDDSIGRVVFLEPHLKRVFIGHRSAGSQEAVFQLGSTFARRFGKQPRDVATVSVLLQVALHYRVADRRVDAGID